MSISLKFVNNEVMKFIYIIRKKEREGGVSLTSYILSRYSECMQILSFSSCVLTLIFVSLPEILSMKNKH